MAKVQTMVESVQSVRSMRQQVLQRPRLTVDLNRTVPLLYRPVHRPGIITQLHLHELSDECVQNIHACAGENTTELSFEANVVIINVRDSKEPQFSSDFTRCFFVVFIIHI